MFVSSPMNYVLNYKYFVTVLLLPLAVCVYISVHNHPVIKPPSLQTRDLVLACPSVHSLPDLHLSSWVISRALFT